MWTVTAELLPLTLLKKREKNREEEEIKKDKKAIYLSEKDRKEEALRAPVVASLWFPLMALLTVWCLGQIPPR